LEWQRRFQDLHISWYDQCGHSPFCEDGPRFNRELADFVREATG
jgi:pimeloyl-ACP methyl ester carboxylesterase